jgi:hypothetical protein
MNNSEDALVAPQPDTGRRGRIALVWYVVFPLLSFALAIPLVHWHVTPGVSDVSNSDGWRELIDAMAIVAFLSFFLSAFVLVVSVPLLIFRRTRRAGFLALACALAHIVGQRAGGSWNTERNAYLSVATRSKPLIAAVSAYEKEYGHPPDSLGQLVPRFIPEIPKTGISGCPEYELVTGEKASSYYMGNPWVLRIRPPQVGIGFDDFFYFPLQNYPKTGYGGWLERIGDWAYVHE